MKSPRLNVIELNGKLYDVKTGKLLTSDKMPLSKRPARRSLDGVAAPQPTTTKTSRTANVSLKKISSPTKAMPIKLSSPRTAASNHKRQPQKSTILMRRAVKKPTLADKAPEISPFTTKSRLGVKASRAQAIPRSPYIKKYNSTLSRPIVKRVDSIAVSPSPTTKSSQPNRSSTNQPARRTTPPSKTTTPRASEKLFTDALQKATSSTVKKSATKKRASKKLKLSSSLVAVLLFMGFVTYINLPNIHLKFAGMQAGFSASLPSYTPDGYSFAGQIKSDAGKIAIGFRSNTDNRLYTVKQEVSNWNSASLQENFLVANNQSFTVTEDKGRTIYFYGKNNATWVNGGVWYQIESSALSPEQLVNIASSL